MSNDHQGAGRPKLAALAVLPHDGHVLLVRRKKAPDAGLWGFPGGHVEPGEPVFAAAARELMEETGVRAQARQWLTNLEIIRHDEAGQLAHHFLLAAVLMNYEAGVPEADDDVSDARWVLYGDVLAGALEMSADVKETLQLALAAG